MAIINSVSSDFDPCLLIVKNVFDCRLPSVLTIMTGLVDCELQDCPGDDFYLVILN